MAGRLVKLLYPGEKVSICYRHISICYRHMSRVIDCARPHTCMHKGTICQKFEKTCLFISRSSRLSKSEKKLLFSQIRKHFFSRGPRCESE